MTSQQQVALAHPCVEAIDTFHARFYRIVGDWTLGLTMNVGFE